MLSKYFWEWSDGTIESKVGTAVTTTNDYWEQHKYRVYMHVTYVSNGEENLRSTTGWGIPPFGGATFFGCQDTDRYAWGAIMSFSDGDLYSGAGSCAYQYRVDSGSITKTELEAIRDFGGCQVVVTLEDGSTSTSTRGEECPTIYSVPIDENGDPIESGSGGDTSSDEPPPPPPNYWHNPPRPEPAGWMPAGPGADPGSAGHPPPPPPHPYDRSYPRPDPSIGKPPSPFGDGANFPPPPGKDAKQDESEKPAGDRNRDPNNPNYSPANAGAPAGAPPVPLPIGLPSGLGSGLSRLASRLASGIGAAATGAQLGWDLAGRLSGSSGQAADASLDEYFRRLENQAPESAEDLGRRFQEATGNPGIPGSQNTPLPGVGENAPAIDPQLPGGLGQIESPEQLGQRLRDLEQAARNRVGDTLDDLFRGPQAFTGGGEAAGTQIPTGGRLRRQANRDTAEAGIPSLPSIRDTWGQSPAASPASNAAGAGGSPFGSPQPQFGAPQILDGGAESPSGDREVAISSSQSPGADPSQQFSGNPFASPASTPAPGSRDIPRLQVSPEAWEAATSGSPGETLDRFPSPQWVPPGGGSEDSPRAGEPEITIIRSRPIPTTGPGAVGDLESGWTQLPASDSATGSTSTTSSGGPTSINYPEEKPPGQDSGSGDISRGTTQSLSSGGGLPNLFRPSRQSEIEKIIEENQRRSRERGDRPYTEKADRDDLKRQWVESGGDPEVARENFRPEMVPDHDYSQPLVRDYERQQIDRDRQTLADPRTSERVRGIARRNLERLQREIDARRRQRFGLPPNAPLTTEDQLPDIISGGSAPSEERLRDPIGSEGRDYLDSPAPATDRAGIEEVIRQYERELDRGVDVQETPFPPFAPLPAGGGAAQPPGGSAAAPSGCNPSRDPCGATATNQNSQMGSKLDNMGSKLDILTAGLTAGDMALTNSKLDTINSKLGDQIPNGGIAGKLNRVSEMLKLPQAFAAINTLLLLHNAAMLSRNLSQTLGDTLSQGLGLIGVKDEDGNAVDINQIIGSQIDSLLASILGEQVWSDTKSHWARANKIISSAAQITNTIRSIADSSREIAEWTGENLGKFMNAAKSDGVVSSDAFNWQPENLSGSHGWAVRVRSKIENLDETASSLSSVVGEAVSISEEANQLQDNIDKFQGAIETNDKKERPDNQPRTQQATEEDSVSGGADLSADDAI